ncbi:MAG: hypothetical protein SO010_10355 [Candidatus Limiplasma sp.]|nr:hypothetical protein [Candidatus Limiplasma sp.]MDY4063295.1 hypothetical protein [Candidatus Limiplasma sp.]
MEQTPFYPQALYVTISFDGLIIVFPASDGNVRACAFLSTDVHLLQSVLFLPSKAGKRRFYPVFVMMEEDKSPPAFPVCRKTPSWPLLPANSALRPTPPHGVAGFGLR